MKIGWWDCGNLDNQYCGSDGGSNLRIPLLKRLNQQGHTILAEMPDPGNYEYREAGLREIDSLISQDFMDQAKRFRESLDFVIETDLRDVMGSLDAVVVEARKREFDEYDRQQEVMKAAMLEDVPLFVLDRNNWAKKLPINLQSASHLLRPYARKQTWAGDQSYFPYFYRTDLPRCTLDPEFDLVYVGNRYGREEQMDNFLEGLDELDILVCGNWTERDQEVTENHDFTFVGPTPHYSTIPTLKLGRATFHVGKPDYNQLGFLTLRPYEAQSASRPCFINADIELPSDYDNYDWVTNDADWVSKKLNDSMLRGDSVRPFNRSQKSATSHLEELIRHERL